MHGFVLKASHGELVLSREVPTKTPANVENKKKIVEKRLKKYHTTKTEQELRWFKQKPRREEKKRENKKKTCKGIRIFHTYTQWQKEKPCENVDAKATTK